MTVRYAGGNQSPSGCVLYHQKQDRVFRSHSQTFGSFLNITEQPVKQDLIYTDRQKETQFVDVTAFLLLVLYTQAWG